MMSQLTGDSMSRQYVITIPDYVKELADAGKAEELGIPLWLAYEIANGTPRETVTEFADRCSECGREKVLDKIMDEVFAIDDEIVLNPDSIFDRKAYVRLNKVIDIIDKYKPHKSEGKG